ncbi:MAG: hypothetical protein OXF66_06045 [Gammaproteobacteria bacterium]|nr:hypothetical protein [Gammaproteobacteria bacterium]
MANQDKIINMGALADRLKKLNDGNDLLAAASGKLNVRSAVLIIAVGGGLGGLLAGLLLGSVGRALAFFGGVPASIVATGVFLGISLGGLFNAGVLSVLLLCNQRVILADIQNDLRKIASPSPAAN